MPIAILSFFSSFFENFDPLQFLIIILVLCVSLSIHERSHAWAAYKLGDDTAALQGRLSLNPLVHLDPIGSLVFIVSSLSGLGGIGWAKPVPINPTRFDRKYSLKKGIVLTSIAGPLSNLILASAAACIFYILETIRKAAGIPSGSNMILSILSVLMIFMYRSNIVLGLFNLLPIPPLDGYKVFGAALPGSVYYKIMRYEHMIGIVFLGLILLFRGALSYVLGIIRWPFDQVVLGSLNLFFEWVWNSFGINIP